MHFAKTATILLILSLAIPSASALAQTETQPNQDKQATRVKAAGDMLSTRPTKKIKQRRSRSAIVVKPVNAVQPTPPTVALVSGPPEYLSGEASVTVKGNENPIVRLGLASSGVTLVEFPASDKFFALHPGNSEMVTIDDSPTKQSDHFFVFRAGATFVSPPLSKTNSGAAASIIAQMRSGMVVTFLIYPVRELSQMAHRVVILYDRAEIVSARRAAGLAVNLEEKLEGRQERSIRIADRTPSPLPRESDDPDDKEHGRPRSVGRSGNKGSSTDPADDKSPADSDNPSPSFHVSTVGPERDLASEARKALKLAITSSRFKGWTDARHGLSIAVSTPKDLVGKDGTAIVILAVSNILPEPLRIVPGQPDLSVETRDEQGKKTLLVEQVKPLYIECSGIGDSIPARSTLYYAMIYRRPVLGVRQHLRVTVGQTNAADDPATLDLTTLGR